MFGDHTMNLKTRATDNYGYSYAVTLTETVHHLDLDKKDWELDSSTELA
jgi:hypothetical protein